MIVSLCFFSWPPQPVLKFLKADCLFVALSLHLPRLRAPGIEPALTDTSRADPSEAPLVLAAVCQKDLVVAPRLRPLADRSSLLAGTPVGVQRRVAVFRCGESRDKEPALAVLADPRPQFPFDTLAHIEVNQIIDRPRVQYPKQRRGTNKKKAGSLLGGKKYKDYPTH